CRGAREPRNRSEPARSCEHLRQRLSLVTGEPQLERLADRIEVLGPAGTDDDGGDLVLREQPGERKPGHRDAALARLVLEAPERVEVRVGLARAVALGPLRHPRAVRVRLAAAVLPREPASGEWAEALVADAVLTTDGEDGLRVGVLEQRVR